MHTPPCVTVSPVILYPSVNNGWLLIGVDSSSRSALKPLNSLSDGAVITCDLEVTLSPLPVCLTSGIHNHCSVISHKRESALGREGTD